MKWSVEGKVIMPKHLEIVITNSKDLTSEVKDHMLQDMNIRYL